MADRRWYTAEHLKAELETAMAICAPGQWVAEHVFCKDRGWRFDYALRDKKVAIEVEGTAGASDLSRHQLAKGYTKDCFKYNCAAMMGWRVVRLTPIMMHTEGYAFYMVEWLSSAKCPSQTSPSTPTPVPAFAHLNAKLAAFFQDQRQVVRQSFSRSRPGAKSRP